MNTSELTELLKIFEKRITHLETKNADLERKFIELSNKLSSQSDPLHTSQPSNITKLLNEMALKSSGQKYQFQQAKKMYTKDEMLEIKRSDLQTAALAEYNVEGYSNIEMISEKLNSSSREQLPAPAPLSMSGVSSFTSPVNRNNPSITHKLTPPSLSQRFKAATVTPEEVSPVRNKGGKPIGRIVTVDRSLQSKSLEDTPSASSSVANQVTPPAKIKFDPNSVVQKVATPPPPSKTEMRYGLMVQIPAEDGDCRGTEPAAMAPTAGAAIAVESVGKDEIFNTITPVVSVVPSESRSITPPVVGEEEEKVDCV